MYLPICLNVSLTKCLTIHLVVYLFNYLLGKSYFVREIKCRKQIVRNVDCISIEVQKCPQSNQRGKVSNCPIAFEPRLCALCRYQWVMNTLTKVWAPGLLLRRYCIFTVFLNKCRGPPQRYQKNWLSNFDLKLCIETDLNENSFLWLFQIFSIWF